MSEISIIIPVYNVEKYIRKCIDSVLSQTFTDIEVILVDDGSTDDSGKICDEYSRVDSRIKVIHKNNGGLSSARNAGIEIANGKYLGFVDSDDYIANDMFEMLYFNIIKENADLSICGIFHCYESKKPVVNSPWYGVLNSEQAIEYAFLGKFFSVNAVTKLYKRHLFDTIRYPDGKTSEDAFIIVDILSQCNKIVATSKQKYFYFHREGSITTVKSAANCFDCIDAYQRNKDIIAERYPRLINIAMSRYCWSFFYALDRLLVSEDEEKYLDRERDIIRFLRKKIFFVIFKSSLSKHRKMSEVVLLFNSRLYKRILLKYLQNKSKLNA